MDLGIKSEGEFDDILKASGAGKWTLLKNWYRGPEFWKIRGLTDSGVGKSIYKLVLKKEWTSESKDSFEEKGARGAFSLIKATWNGTKKWDIKEEKVDSQNKVWLIVAKGKENVYLMPVVRASGRWGGDGCSKTSENDEAGKQIFKEGVTDIKTWTGKYDKGKWDENSDKKLKGLISSGISITRKPEIAKWEWNQGGIKYGAEESAINLVEKLRIGESLAIRNGGKIKFLYKNAGVLSLGEINKNNENCQEIEHYFPLDLVALREVTIKGNTKRDGERLTIADEITDVIGVRLDQVVINKEGIGDGSGRLLL